MSARATKRKPSRAQGGVERRGNIIAEAAWARRHILFDLDGTLVDSNAACVSILQDMLVERGSARLIDPAKARAFMSLGGEHMVGGVLAENCADAAADLTEFRARYSAHTTSADTVYDGVFEGMARLAAAGFTMAICSNKPQALCEKVLADTGLDAFITAAVGGDAPCARPAGAGAGGLRLRWRQRSGLSCRAERGPALCLHDLRLCRRRLAAGSSR